MPAKIWIVLEQREGRLHRMSREAIAAGQQLAVSLGGEAAAVVLGAGVDAVAAEVAECRLGAVKVIDDAKLADYAPGTYVGALAAAAAAAPPDLMLFPHTYQSVDYVPRLAQTLEAALVSEIVGFEAEGDAVVWRRPVLGGKLQAEVTVRPVKTALVTVQSGVFAADQVEKGSAPIERLELDLSAVEPQREILGVEEAASQEVDLTQAQIIVAVGRGVGDADKMGVIKELAEALGAEIGASRPVIDSGWLPRDRQIGSSGQTVAPKLYLAAGISGAIQHLVGMKGAQTVVAINKDASAPIFGVAHYGVVGDLHEILPALTAAIREARGG